MATVYSVPQVFSTTLNVGGGINNSQTSGIVLTSVTGLPTDGGILCFDWASTLDTSVAEYIEYTGISANTLTGVTRGAEGFSAKAHSNGAVIAGVISQAHIKRLKDKLDGTDTTGASIKQVTDTSLNEVVTFTKVASAVNQIDISNNATGSAPIISAAGGDTNIDIVLTPKGTGGVKSKKRVGSTTSSTTPTINTDLYDVYRLTAQAADITSFTTNLSGTPNEGDMLLIEITGTAARAITWGASFEASTVALPTTTVTTAMLQVLFKWNSATSKWRVLASV